MTAPAALETLEAIRREEFRRRLMPPPKLTVAEWSERYAVLSREDSAEPGRYTVARAPYQREILDAFSDPEVHTVVVMSASQVGKTQVVKNVLGYFVDQDPSPILVVQYSVEEAESFSKIRVAPMIRDTPRLRGVVQDPSSRKTGNTLRMKEFPGGHLTIVGANSPAGLAAKPIRILLGDEVDRWPASAGSEGDPMDLAKARQRTFWNRKSGWFSSPTIEAGRIYKAYMEGDQREYWVPCYACGTFQLLRFGNLRGERGLDGHIIPESVRYPCVGCGLLWEEHDKPRLLAAGEWRARQPLHGIASFHVGGMLSPWFTWAEIQDAYNKAKGDWQRRQVFTNTVLGDVWKEDVGGLDPKGLEGRVGEDYPDPPAEVPAPVSLITQGVDVQADRLEVSTWGFGAGMERWRIRHDVLHGDTTQGDVWKRLDELRLRTFLREDGEGLRVWAMAVDGGYNSKIAHEYCRPRYGARVFVVRGSSTAGAPWIPKHASRPSRGGAPVFFLGTECGKDDWYGALKVGAPGPNYVHFDRGTDAVYLKQLTSERAEIKLVMGKGYIRRYVLPDGQRSEALDCAVYALAALYLSGYPRERLGSGIVSRATPKPAEPATPPPPEPEPASPAREELRRVIRPPVRPRGWVNGWRS